MNWRTLSLGIVLLFGAALSVVSQPVLKVDVSSWKTYTNSVLGIEFKHPNCQISEKKTKSGAIVITDCPGTVGVEFSALFNVSQGANPNGVPIDKWLSEQMKGADLSSVWRSTTVAGRPALQRELVTPTSNQRDYVLGINGKDVLQLALSRMSSAAQKGRFDATFEGILSTLRFLK